jgi:hypothetical protein
MTTHLTPYLNTSIPTFNASNSACMVVSSSYAPLTQLGHLSVPLQTHRLHGLWIPFQTCASPLKFYPLPTGWKHGDRIEDPVASITWEDVKARLREGYESDKLVEDVVETENSSIDLTSLWPESICQKATRFVWGILGFSNENRVSILPRSSEEFPLIHESENKLCKMLGLQAEVFKLSEIPSFMTDEIMSSFGFCEDAGQKCLPIDPSQMMYTFYIEGQWVKSNLAFLQDAKIECVQIGLRARLKTCIEVLLKYLEKDFSNQPHHGLLFNTNSEMYKEFTSAGDSKLKFETHECNVYINENSKMYFLRARFHYTESYLWVDFSITTHGSA